jgi:4a-hydroxytetrahydrobiopterin dehydratase
MNAAGWRNRCLSGTVTAMDEELTAKICIPCQGGIAPLAEPAAQKFLEQTPGWELAGAASRIERKFSFADFAGTLAFVNQVGALAEAEGHHPDIAFGWGYCTITLYTHKIDGLHENDFILAAKINEL